MTFAARDFWARQGASDAHTLQSSVRSEQRRLVQKEPPPGGLRRFSVLASLLLGHSPTAGDAPSSRLARTEKRCNKRHRIYELEYLVLAAVAAPLIEFVRCGHAKPKRFAGTNRDPDASFLETRSLWSIDREANYLLVTGSFEGGPENLSGLGRRLGQQLLLAAPIECNDFCPLRTTAPR